MANSTIQGLVGVSSVGLTDIVPVVSGGANIPAQKATIQQVKDALFAGSPNNSNLGLAESFSTVAGGVLNYCGTGSTVNGNFGNAGLFTLTAGVLTINNGVHVDGPASAQNAIIIGNSTTPGTILFDTNAVYNNLSSLTPTFQFANGVIDLATDATHGPAGVYTPGVYKTGTAGAATMSTAAPITLNGPGRYVFLINGAISTAANFSILLTNGAKAEDVFFVTIAGAAGNITFGANNTIQGNFLSGLGAIGTGANNAITGRLIANGATTVACNNTISVPTVGVGTGNVVGPGAATDNAIARYDGTSGTLIQNSLVTVSDLGSVNIPLGQTYNINNVPLAIPITVSNTVFVDYTLGTSIAGGALVERQDKPFSTFAQAYIAIAAFYVGPTVPSATNRILIKVSSGTTAESLSTVNFVDLDLGDSVFTNAFSINSTTTNSVIYGNASLKGIQLVGSAANTIKIYCNSVVDSSASNIQVSGGTAGYLYLKCNHISGAANMIRSGVGGGNMTIESDTALGTSVIQSSIQSVDSGIMNIQIRELTSIGTSAVNITVGTGTIHLKNTKIVHTTGANGCILRSVGTVVSENCTLVTTSVNSINGQIKIYGTTSSNKPASIAPQVGIFTVDVLVD